MIEDPDGTAMRRDEHRVVARMDRDLVDAYVREVGLELLPARAAIEREVDAGLSADVQHVAVLRIFGERANVLAAQVVRDRLEGLAEVRAHPDVRLVVVQ